MMLNINNKMLLILALIATVLIFAGVIINLSTIKNLQVEGAVVHIERATVNISIVPTVSISLVKSEINFSAASPGKTRNSENASQVEPDGGFNITNDGSTEVNISFTSNTEIFTGTTDAESFQCRVESDFDGNSQNTYTDCRASVGKIEAFIAALTFATGNSAEVHVNLTIPIDELSGTKNSSITFTATAT